MQYDFNKIIERAEFWRAYDTRIQSKLGEFIEAVAPSSYAPSVEQGCLDAYLSAFPKEIKDWLSYYFYEAPGMESAEVREKDGTKWDFKDREQVIKFLEKEFAENNLINPKGINELL